MVQVPPTDMEAPAGWTVDPARDRIKRGAIRPPLSEEDGAARVLQVRVFSSWPLSRVLVTDARSWLASLRSPFWRASRKTRPRRSSASCSRTSK